MKSKRNCIIVHGSNDSEAGAKEYPLENLRHWKPWLQEQLEKKDISTSNDLYPKDWAPNYSAWKKVFEKNVINQNTILVGHSAGTAFILRWLAENKQDVDRVVLVAPSIFKSEKYRNLTFKDFTFGPELKDYFNKLVVFYSDDDDEDIIKSAKQIHSILGGDLVLLKDKGHFVYEDMGTNEFPELLKACVS